MARAAIALLFAIASGYGCAGERAVSRDRAIVALAFNATDGTLIEASADGLSVSANNGSTWQAVELPTNAARGRIAAMAVSAGAHPVLYVAGPDFGVARSPDNGRSWAPANDGLPSRDITSLTAHAVEPNTVYAYVPARGIFRSEDAGAHWRLMDAGPRDPILQLVHSDMAGSMQTGWLFAATAKGVGRSMDCFCGWRDAGALGTSTHAVAYDIKDPKRVYAAAADALFASSDGGEHWSRMPSPAKEVTALLGTRDGLLFAGTREGDVYESADHGTTWRHAG